MSKIFRQSYNGDRKYLTEIDYENVITTPAVVRVDHGKLVDRNQAGNGYHGRCEHCGTPLHADLGYNSWEGTTCITPESHKIVITPDIFWVDNINEATWYNTNHAERRFRQLVQDQGWGTFNFGILTQ